jgi:hypothetical protein
VRHESQVKSEPTARRRWRLSEPAKGRRSISDRAFCSDRLRTTSANYKAADKGMRVAENTR